ncbi:transcriptional regulator with XRE-family HTH domain [Catenulispora sp. GAS73]|uniref:helix-turn-helix domain-containing protein n=1 Tax=Catenulispora sp. GAS73 TaxID=3156269 RepID=UPI0035177DD2
MSEAQGTSSTVRRLMLGSQLRRLREAAHITREAAGYEIRSSESKISRLELGRVGFKVRDVADLLTLYGVTDEQERAPLLSMADAANAASWWHGYHDVLPSWFANYVGLEAAADLIRTYEVQFIPGLLQIPDYTRAVVARGNTALDADVERRVAIRQERQHVLSRDENPPRFWAVLDEAAVRRPMGSPEIMRRQLTHLLELMERPNVTVQLLPFECGAQAADAGAFTILRFAEQDLPDVVYLEHLSGALYLDKPDDVDVYLQVMERTSVNALTPVLTTEALAKLINEF